MLSNEVVHIVDDEQLVREALASLFAAAGLSTSGHASAELFYQSFDPTVPGCIVVDVCLPGMSGLSLQAKLAQANFSIPVVFLTGHADVPMAVEAMAKGAFGFLQKPPRSHELLELVTNAVEWHRANLDELSRLERHAEKFRRLTEREREILRHVVDGYPNKEIAEQFGISQRTVEQHRAHVMHKLEVDSVAELVRIALDSCDNAPTLPFRKPQNPPAQMPPIAAARRNGSQ